MPCLSMRAESCPIDCPILFLSLRASLFIIRLTTSTSLPTDAEGSPLVGSFPDDPHAYVKLWKHARAQPFAERIISEGKIPSQVSEGRLSGESLLAKAAETEAASPV